ncbi:MAG: hypothetical protein PHF51_03550 [Candidatus ainarchaeum sp.]|nr:hypothetical protein [Candidatus ainarchaeum sp.]
MTGDWPNDAAYRVEVYSAAQGNPCDANPDVPGELLYNSSDTFSYGNALFDSNDEYAGSFEMPASPTTLHIYFCKTGDPVGSSRVYFTRSTTDAESLEVDFAKAAGNAATHDDLAGDFMEVCDDLDGGTHIASTATVADPSGQYEQYYYMVEPSVQVNGGNLADVYVYFDTDGLLPCTFDDTIEAGVHVLPNQALPYDYGVYVSDYSPDTKITSAAHADIATTGYIALYRNDGSDENVGMTGELTASPYNLYYDNPATGTITAYVYTGAVPDTAADENVTNIALGSSGDALDLSILIGGSVPDEVATIETTIGGLVYTVAPTGAAGSRVFALYIPTGETPTIIFNNTAGDELFSYLYGGAVAADQTLSIAKFWGSSHANLDGETIQFFEDDVCTVTTNIQSVAITPASGAYEGYVIYQYGPAAGATTVTDFYPGITDGAFVTCGATTGAVGGDSTVNKDYTALITGTVSTGISAAGGVYFDIGGAAGYDAGTDPYTETFSSGEYRLYVIPDGPHDVVFTSDNQAAGFLVTELSRAKTAAAGTETVNVAQIDWQTADIHADLVNAGGGTACGVGAGDECQLIVYPSAGGAALSSETRGYDVDDSQFYEVPAADTVDPTVEDNAGGTVLFYVSEYAATAGDAVTFEPEVKVNMVAPAGILAWEIADGDTFAYRDNTIAEWDIYVDGTEEGTSTYTYNAYTDVTFATEVLTRGTKDASGADATWYVNSVTSAAIHTDLDTVVDPLTVYLTAGTITDCDSATALSSTTTVAMAAGNVKYYEGTLGGGDNVEVKVTLGSYETCVNTLIAEVGGGADSTEYDFDVKTNGSVSDGVISVGIDSDAGGGDDVTQATVGSSPSTYAIYWAGANPADISYYDVTPTLLLTRNKNLAATSTINVGRVSGACDAANSVTDAQVYDVADCTTALSSETAACAAAAYAQYFEDTGSVFLGATDGTYTQCKLDALTVTAEEATSNLDRVLDGTVPDLSDATLAAEVLSAAVIIDGGVTDDYSVDVVDNGATSDYILYVDSAAAGAGDTINFYDAVAAGGNLLLTRSKDFSADATVDVSAAYGEAHADIEGGSNTVAVCYGTMPTTNADCSTKASSATVTPSAAGGNDYEIFFEQVTVVTAYYLRVNDVDTVSYYSWNGFESTPAGDISGVELDGQLKGAITESFDATKGIDGVLVKMYSDGLDPDTDRISTAYSYDGGSPASPTGNYRMYGNFGTTYDAQYSKPTYITQTWAAPGGLDQTHDVSLVPGIKIVVETTDSTPVFIETATVTILNCSSEAICNADTPLADVCRIAGIDDQPCIITGDGSSGTGENGEYYFSGIPDGEKVKIKVEKTGYISYEYPSANDDPTTNFYTTSSTVQISATVQLPQNNILAQVALLTPLDNAWVTDTTPTVSWEDVANEDGYEVQVDDTADFSSVVDTCDLAAGVVTTDIGSTCGATALTDGVRYYWRVRATDDNATDGEWSDVRQFVVDVSAPTVSASGPSALQNTRSVTITATTNENAECRYATADGPYSGMTDVMAGTTTIHEMMVLATDRASNTYYVRCSDAAGNPMAASEEITFLVNATAPSLIDVTPDYNATTPYNSTTLAALSGIQIKTDIAANCKWDVKDASYANMAYGPFATVADTWTTVDGASAEEGLNLFYVRCQTTDGSALTMSSSGLVSFNYDSVAPTYTVLSVRNDGNYHAYVNESDVVVIKIEASELLAVDPTITLGAVAPDAACTVTGDVYTCEWTIDSSFADGSTPDLSVGGGSDAAGNPDEPLAQADVVIVDKTAPFMSNPLPATTQNSRSFQVSVDSDADALYCAFDTNDVNYSQMQYYATDLGNNTFLGTLVVPTDETSYVVYFACTDAAGNVNTTRTASFLVDAKAPTITASSPQGGYKNSTQTLNVTTDANANCKYDVQDRSYATMAFGFATGNGSTAHTTDVTPAAQGDIHYYVACADLNGNAMNSSIVTYFTYDTIAPTVTRSNDWISSDTYHTFMFSDEALGGIVMTFDGNAMTQESGNGTLFLFSYDVSAVADGDYEVDIGSCADLAGNNCLDPLDYYPYNVTLDTEAPGITAISYNFTNWLLAVTTNESAVCKYSYANDAYADMPYGMSDSNLTSHYALVVPRESSTPVYVYVACSDYYGNVMATTNRTSIAQDTQHPYLVDAGPMLSNSSNVTMWVQTNENSTCEYGEEPFEYGSGTAMTTADGMNHSVDFTGLDDGPYSYYARCSDLAGNVGDAEFVRFSVDTTGNFEVVPYWLGPGWDGLPGYAVSRETLSQLAFLGADYAIGNVLETHGGLANTSYDLLYGRNRTSGLYASYVPGRAVNDLTQFHSDYETYPGYVIHMTVRDRLELS